MLSLSQDMKKESGLRTIYIEISIILKFMERRPKTPGIIFKKYGMPQRKSTACGDFYAVLDEKDADIFQNTKKWNWGWIV